MKKLVCNKCGKELDVFDLNENYDFRLELGYGTIYDGEKVEIRMCCDCMEEFIDACKVSPIVSNT